MPSGCAGGALIAVVGVNGGRIGWLVRQRSAGDEARAGEDQSARIRRAGCGYRKENWQCAVESLLLRGANLSWDLSVRWRRVS